MAGIAVALVALMLQLVVHFYLVTLRSSWAYILFIVVIAGLFVMYMGNDMNKGEKKAQTEQPESSSPEITEAPQSQNQVN